MKNDINIHVTTNDLVPQLWLLQDNTTKTAQVHNNIKYKKTNKGGRRIKIILQEIRHSTTMVQHATDSDWWKFCMWRGQTY